MKGLRHTIATLMLFAWIFAGAHLAIEHGGVAFCSHVEESLHAEHHHDHESAPEQEHHHDFDSATAAMATKVSAKPNILVSWEPVLERLAAELAAQARAAAVQRGRCFAGDSPPDARDAGWLLVLQTALPVRGPSLS